MTESSRERPGNGLIRIVRAVTALIWAGLIVFALIHRDDISIDNILGYTPDNPFLAALAVQAMFVLKSLTFVFYSGALYIVNGILFPLPVAILLNILGTMVMTVTPYALGRSLGTERADELRQKYSGIGKVEELRNRNETAFVILLRCVKVVNFDLGSTFLGAAGADLPVVWLGSVLGMLPDIVLFPVIGANLDDPGSPAFWIAIGLDILIAVVTVVISKKVSAGGGDLSSEGGDK